MLRPRTLLLAKAAGVSIVAAILFGTGDAHADTGQDYVFYSTLTNTGFAMWDPPVARLQGLAVCGDMAKGTPWRLTMTKLINIGYSLDSAADLMVAATAAYCPGLSPQNQDNPAPAPADGGQVV